jgi:hypothetical protein
MTPPAVPLKRRLGPRACPLKQILGAENQNSVTHPHMMAVREADTLRRARALI